MTLRISKTAFRFAYEVLSRLQPRRAAPYPASPQVLVYENKGQQDVAVAESSRTIPKKIWSYWHQAEPDAFVSRCIANWRTHCPDFEVQVLNQHTVQDYVPAHDLPQGFERLNPVKQSDWIRLYLVSRYGGYWVDATIVLTQSLSWLEALRAQHEAEFAGFYLGGYTHAPRCPVIENWAFGAAAGTPFVTAWHKEFHHALFEVGTEAYLASLQSQPDYAELLQGIPDPVYLLGHVTAQRVLRQGHHSLRLALLKAEDTAFFYQKALRWKWYLLYPRLCLVPADPHIAPLVKLRGGERRHFTQLFAQHGDPLPGSLWDKACRPVP